METGASGRRQQKNATDGKVPDERDLGAGCGQSQALKATTWARVASPPTGISQTTTVLVARYSAHFWAQSSANSSPSRLGNR